MRWSIAAAGLVLFAAIGWPLFERVEYMVNVPLAAGHEANAMTFVRILPDRTRVDDGAGSSHRTALAVGDAARLLRHRRIRILVSIFGTHPDLERAELAFVGSRCVYRTAPGAEFPNNSGLELVRGDGCTPLEVVPTSRMELTVLLRNSARLALWAHATPPSAISSDTLIVEPPPDLAGPEALVVSGRLVDEGLPSARHRRIDLLAYMWQVTTGSRWIWLALSLGTVAITLGFQGLWSPARPRTIAASGAVRRGFSAFLVSAGLGLLYAVLTPPFQAPDEPYHFVTVAEVAGRPQLVPQIQAWSELAHVTRLRFRPAEQFTPSDIGHPEQIREPWYAPASSIRGGGAHLLWAAVAPVVRPLPAPQVFLALRLTHVLFLALVIGLSVATLVRVADVPSPSLLAFPILLVPTLPFFGMHVSNHAPLIAAYVVIAVGLALIVILRNGGYVTGLMVGIGWALAITLSRSAMPLAPLIAAVAGARLLFGPLPPRLRASSLFWAGLILPVVIVLTISDATYLDTNAKLGASMLPDSLGAPVELLTRSPWLLSLAVPLLAGVEFSLSRLRARTGHSLRPAARVVTWWGALAAAAVVAVLMIGSILVRYPVLATVDALNRPPAMEYARDAVWAGLTILRIAQPDYRTSVSFWGGFGWLETLPSDWFVSLLTGATGIALVGLLIRIAWTSDTRRAVFLTAAIIGFSASLAAYALSLLQIVTAIGSQLKVELAIDVTGRYVFGLYLTMVVLCWSGVSWLPNDRSDRRLQAAVSLGCVLACTGIHVYCLRLILYRYF